MADRDKAKQKHHAKREQKRRQRAKREQQRHRTLSWATGPADCYISENWQEQGMANLMVFREGPGDRWAFAGFLIDTFCIGLKDAYSTDEYLPEDFEMAMDEASTMQNFAPISLDGAQKLLSSAVRWSRMHQFRMPKGWEKAASIFGDLGDIDTADISFFGENGRLHYIGRERDLVSRLAGQTLEEFMARPDVDVTFMEPEEVVSDDDDPGEDMLGELAAGMAEQSREMADAMRRWCFRAGRIPPEQIEAACQFVNFILMQAALEAKSLEDAHISKMHDRILSLAEEADRAEPQGPAIRPAVAQVLEFIDSPEGQEMLRELVERDMNEDDET